MRHRRCWRWDFNLLRFMIKCIAILLYPSFQVDCPFTIINMLCLEKKLIEVFFSLIIWLKYNSFFLFQCNKIFYVCQAWNWFNNNIHLIGHRILPREHRRLCSSFFSNRNVYHVQTARNFYQIGLKMTNSNHFKQH